MIERPAILNEPGNENLKPFRVEYVEYYWTGHKSTLHFDCWAEDEDHAIEQCENAYETCDIVISAAVLR